MAIDYEPWEAALSKWKRGGLADEEQKAAAATLVTLTSEILASGSAGSVEPALWHEYLRLTGKPEYLKALAGSQARSSWAENCFDIIRLADYSLLKLFEDRVAEFPDRILFRDFSLGQPGEWSYRTILRKVRETAAVFHTLAAPADPRVALYTGNCPVGACCDLACLFFDILDAPLNVNFPSGILIEIFDRLGINIVVTDTRERLATLRGIRQKTRSPFQIVVLESAWWDGGEDVLLFGEACRRLGEEQIRDTLDQRPRRSMHEVATVMFTSGSTGSPKGVSFSQFNLVTKRFARAAALPEVGDDEVLLCYLPLYHTFGRFLEMLGSIYWGGTYVFAGNPSAETLWSLLPQVNPTGFISIPLRWAQLREKCLQEMGRENTPAGGLEQFRRLVGKRLRWGLSAAGYLHPQVFRFFQRHGVDLCSGFGMTEATGGITMTPPGEYMDDTTGLPLPGVLSRFTDEGELQISGPYVARYLEEKGPGDLIPYPPEPGNEHWLSTGDLFRVLPNGYFQIVGRVKDIYKNDKGETIAPQRVEKLFGGVPGIKRVFLVGDRRAYNVLLIVPDENDPVWNLRPSQEDRRDYLGRIVAAANRDLAPYERVVNFALLDRDFTLERGEITSKGSFNRKILEQNFSSEIEDLYRSQGVNLARESFQVWIPRWFFRDLGILENQIEMRGDFLWNRSSNSKLQVNLGSETGHIRIGDLEYSVSGDVIDLGLFVRQPRLWVGNPALVSFFPCKEGWDAPLDCIGAQPLRPRSFVREYLEEEIPEPEHFQERMLATVHRLAGIALFSPIPLALKALNQIGELLPQADIRWNEVLRTRLEALATHPDERLRCTAYRILLLDDPSPVYSRAFPAFLKSGLSFLNQDSIELIANSRFETRRLEALRRRLLQYRTHLHWPADPMVQQQFQAVFQLLADFAGRHPEFHHPVRSELAAWSMHRADPLLAQAAEEWLGTLKQRFDTMMAEKTPVHLPEEWDRCLVFDEEFPTVQRGPVLSILAGQNFLEKSIILAYDEKDFLLGDVADGGLLVSPLPPASGFQHVRLRINTRRGKHFDLELIHGDDLRGKSALWTVFWQLALGGWPLGPRVMQRMGCYNPGLGAMSVVFPGDSTAWQKIGDLAASAGPDGSGARPNSWRKLFIQALSTLFRALSYSGFQLVPGTVSPQDVVVPELDFRLGGTIVSLVGCRPYQNTLSIIRPMVENFFDRTVGDYPQCRSALNPDWIFDAGLEAMGLEQGLEFLKKLQSDLQKEPLRLSGGPKLAERLQTYLPQAASYLPLPLFNAIDRYLDWEALNEDATPEARQQTVDEVSRLYRLERFPDIVRYHLYRGTFFHQATGAIADSFDRLLQAARTKPGAPPTRLVELAAFQDTLIEDHDREAFSRMVLPILPTSRQLQITRRVEDAREPFFVSSIIMDKNGERFVFREPVEPREIGQLYRLFAEQRIPIATSEQDRYFVLADPNDRIVGGLCYQPLENHFLQLEGIAVVPPLKDRGLRGAMEEEFCRRMANQEVLAIRARFFSSDFFLWHGYRTDKRFGSLVKFLRSEE